MRNLRFFVLFFFFGTIRLYALYRRNALFSSLLFSSFDKIAHGIRALAYTDKEKKKHEKISYASFV